MFNLFLATPDKKIVSDQPLESVTVPAFAGELNILPGHAPLMTTLEAGILSYKLKGESERRMAISWGYCQVSGDGVSVLAESATEAADLDVEVLKQHLKEAEGKLITEELNDAQWNNVQREVARIKAELQLSSPSKRF